MVKMKDNKCIDWAKGFLISNGYTIKSEAMPITTAPWSIVWKFKTESGCIYLKQTIPEFFIETKVIEVIDRVQSDIVPKVIAVNLDLHCFLMRDAGHTLRERFKNKFDADLLAELIKKYTLLQCAISEQSEALINYGVPDWRLRNLPQMFASLIENDLLLDEIGITTREKSKLNASKKRFSEICERLSSFKIPESLSHCDFHDNNVLYDEKTHHLTVIDLGEVVISHPFFSLHALFFMQEWWGYFKKGDQDYLKTKDACLDNFRQFESEQNLHEIFELTLLLHPLYYVFCIMRLISACDKEGYGTDFTGPDGVVKSLQAQKNNIAGCLRTIISSLQ